MKVMKAVSACASVGGKIVSLCSKVADFADRTIHRKEYERKAKACRRFWTVLLSVAGGILAVLMFPYKIIVKKNGDFEICTLLLHVYRKTDPYDIPEGGSEDFEIAGIPEDADDGDLIAVSDTEGD